MGTNTDRLPYVKAAVSNFKGGVRIELGHKTLLVGTNGRGKSAIINTIEFALDGRVSDIRGRNIVADDKELSVLGPSAEQEPYANVTLSDGRYIEEKLGTVAVRRKNPIARFITRDIEAAIAGSTATLRRFLLDFAVESITRDVVLALLPSDLRAKYTEITSWTEDGSNFAPDGSDAPDEIDLLLLTIDRAKEKARDKAKEAKSQQATAETVNAGAALPPTENEIKAAAAEVEEATAALEKVTSAQSGAAAAASANAMTAASLADAIKKAEAKLHAAQQTVADLAVRAEEAAAAAPKTAPAEISAAMQFQLDGLRMHVAVEKCGLCGSVHPPGHFAARLTKLEALIGERERDSAKLASYEEAKNDLELARSTETSAQEALSELRKVVPISAAAAPIDTNAATAARNVLRAARERHAALIKAGERWKAAEIARDRSRSAAADVAAWKSLSSSCEGAVARLLQSAEEDFTRRVQRWLPAGDKFFIRFGGEKGETRFGFIKEDTAETHVALSGGEWARVVGAIACACEQKMQEKRAARNDTSPLPFPILTLADRAMHPDVVTEVMDALGALPFSVILTSVLKPKEIPKGWTVVTLDEARPRVKKAADAVVVVPDVPAGTAVVSMSAEQKKLGEPSVQSAQAADGGTTGGSTSVNNGPAPSGITPPIVQPQPAAQPTQQQCDADEHCPNPALPDETLADAFFCKMHGADNVPLDIRRELVLLARQRFRDAQAAAANGGKKPRARKNPVAPPAPAAVAAPPVAAVAVPPPQQEAEATDDF